MHRNDVTRARAGNQLGDDGARAVAEAMLVNRTMTDVLLGGTCGSSDVSNTLQRTEVAMSCEGNSIGQLGARAVAEALWVNNTVARINLDGKQCNNGNGVTKCQNDLDSA